MPRTVTRYTIDELSHEQSKNEVLISATKDIEIGLQIIDGDLVIWLPFGNKFNTIGGRIIIKSY